MISRIYVPLSELRTQPKVRCLRSMSFDFISNSPHLSDFLASMLLSLSLSTGACTFRWAEACCSVRAREPR